jgi:hypothetical protein
MSGNFWILRRTTRIERMTGIKYLLAINFLFAETSISVRPAIIDHH